MDMVLIVNIFLASAGILALLVLFMTFESRFLKLLAALAVLLFVTPLLIAWLGNSLGWFDVYTIEIVTLRKGALSIFIAASYGLMTGVILNVIKSFLINQFRAKKETPEE